jgi:hypothetical protein
MKRGGFLAFLVCLYYVEGGGLTSIGLGMIGNIGPRDRVHKPGGLMSNIDLELKGTEETNGGTVTKFEVKLKDTKVTENGKIAHFTLRRTKSAEGSETVNKFKLKSTDNVQKKNPILHNFRFSLKDKETDYENDV